MEREEEGDGINHHNSISFAKEDIIDKRGLSR